MNFHPNSGNDSFTSNDLIDLTYSRPLGYYDNEQQFQQQQQTQYRQQQQTQYQQQQNIIDFQQQYQQPQQQQQSTDHQQQQQQQQEQHQNQQQQQQQQKQKRYSNYVYQVQFSSMKFERQNKKLKEVVVGTTSNINLPMTIAIRNQLQFCHSFEYVPLSENSITKADLGEPVKNDFIESIFPKNENITKIKRFELRNKIFHDGTVFVAEINDDGPKFGIVKNIIHVRSKIYFHILEYKTLCFFKWFHAYKVISTDVENIISADLIPNFPPCLYVQKNYDEFIATRFSL
ncbi:hypothetical protein TKK_0000221 [Trichogramma kaykai]